LQQQETFSLKKQFLRKTTFLSLALSVFLIGLFLSRTSIGDIVRHVRDVDLVFLILAFVCHYASYLVRGDRWRRMIRPAGFSGGTVDLAKIIFLFQAVDCVLPAKVGDVYGAHLMKLNFSMSRSFSLGSIFLWRIIDFVFVTGFAVVSAFILFGSRIPPEVILAMKVAGISLAVVLGLMGLLFHYHKWLPFKLKSERVKGLIDSFRGGLRLNGRIIPSLLIVTAIIWFLEAGRFFFICKSMGVDLNVMPILFITFSSTLFTAIPFTPSGLGAVELGMLKLLAFVGIANPLAYPIIIWDRFIAHWSQILLGMAVILFSKAIRLKVWHFREDKVSSFEEEPSLS